ncbi:uncharacterized protein LOC143486818 isoform X2 [Brachyhypopomus gauderio]
MIQTLIVSFLFLPGLHAAASKKNIALGAQAVQSSTAFSGPAENAVDGNTESDYYQYSCTHTATEDNPWWRVELPDAYNITTVKITNRGDCCSERLYGAQIRIGNSLENNGNDNKLIATVGSRISYKFFPVEGRFVNIIIPGRQKILTLCEVKIFADEFILRNVALKGRATQSSLSVSGMWPGFGLAQNAIDGNRNPDLKKGSCTQTVEETAPWWRVDLHRNHEVYAVALTNRGDCCSERLDGAQIRVGTYIENEGKENPICAVVTSIPAGQTKLFECQRTLEGRYVTVVLPGNGTLSLCEVEVFMSPKFTLRKPN